MLITSHRESGSCRTASLLWGLLGDLGNDTEVFITEPGAWFGLGDDKSFLFKTGDRLPKKDCPEQVTGEGKEHWSAREIIFMSEKSTDLPLRPLEAIFHAG